MMDIKTEDEFIKLINRAEQDVENNKNIYLMKLVLFAALGYLAIFLPLVLLIGLVGGVAATALWSIGVFFFLIKTKLVFGIAFAIWVLLRALWVKFDPPEGYQLKREDFPLLFAELDGLAKQLNAFKVHEVIINEDCNAAVVQYPRLGVLGWQKNYLIIGYPLLLLLSPEEMRSVLAHEFGHLSRNHSRFSSWIYRVRLTWMRLMTELDKAESLGGMLMSKFFDWYSPHFHAYSFVLARSNEYEADAIAAKLTSPEITAQALVNVYVSVPYLDQSYWNNYLKQADILPEPSYKPFAGLLDFMKNNPLSEDEISARIHNEMNEKTHYWDTHPSLQDRVKALNEKPQPPVFPSVNAAEAWLGQNGKKVMSDFDEKWLNDNMDSWSGRYKYVSNAKEQLQVFHHKELTSLTDEDLWNYACWTSEFDSERNALDLFYAFQERYPEDPDPAFQIGNILLSEDDDNGLDQLKRAMNSIHLLERTAHIGYEFLMKKGDEKAAQAWWEESLQKNKYFDAVQEERNSLSSDDELAYPEMDESTFHQLVSDLKKHKNITDAWVVEKVQKYVPEHPIYIIVFSFRGRVWNVSKCEKEIAESIMIENNFFVLYKYNLKVNELIQNAIKTGKKINIY